MWHPLKFSPWRPVKIWAKWPLLVYSAFEMYIVSANLGSFCNYTNFAIS